MISYLADGASFFRFGDAIATVLAAVVSTGAVGIAGWQAYRGRRDALADELLDKKRRGAWRFPRGLMIKVPEIRIQGGNAAEDVGDPRRSKSEEIYEESLSSAQLEIYKAHHDSALLSSKRFSTAAYITFIAGVLILFAAATMVLFGAVAASVTTGVIALVDFASGALFSSLATKEQSRADEKFNKINDEVDRSRLIRQRMRIANSIDDKEIRNQVLAQLALSEVLQNQSPASSSDAAIQPQAVEQSPEPVPTEADDLPEDGDRQA